MAENCSIDSILPVHGLMIDREAMAAYLNDHLAGSVGALEMMERIVEEHEGAAIAHEIAFLRQGVEADQHVLKQLIASVGAKESVAAKAIGWVGEKVSRLRVSLDVRPETDFRLLESLEALALGFQGRFALWKLLETVRNDFAVPQNFLKLASDVETQIGRLDKARLSVARSVLTHSRRATSGNGEASGR